MDFIPVFKVNKKDYQQSMGVWAWELWSVRKNAHELTVGGSGHVHPRLNRKEHAVQSNLSRTWARAKSFSLLYKTRICHVRNEDLVNEPDSVSAEDVGSRQRPLCSKGPVPGISGCSGFSS